MSALRERKSKWQSIVRVQGHPILTKTFTSRTDAKRWGAQTELKLRRGDAGIAKIHFLKFIIKNGMDFYFLVK